MHDRIAHLPSNSTFLKNRARSISTMERNPATTRATVLVVDDGIIIAEDIRRRLEASGYSVVDIVTTGEEAIERARTIRPDLVLMDIRLDGVMDGIEAAQKIKSLFEIPVVFVTAYSDEATLTRVKAAGSFGFVVKPVEARELRTTIDLALHKHAAERCLRVSEERHRRLIDSSPDAVIIVDPAGAITACNRRTVDILGFRCAEVLAGKSFFDFVAQEERERAAEFVSGIFSGDSPGMCDCRILHIDGGAIPVEINAAPVNDRHGIAKEAILDIRDITGRRHIEDQHRLSLLQKEVLLKELHHRMKNNLSVIASLLSLQSCSVEDEEALNAFKESQTRIESMALIHQQLSRSNGLKDVDLSEYFTQLTSLLFRAYGNPAGNISLSLHLDNIHIGIEKAIPAGIIVNELVSNSLKHAFPAKRKGEVAVEIHATTDAVTLIVRDDGVGLPHDWRLEESASFGLELVRMLTETMKGSLVIEREHGTRIAIAFPA